MKYRVVSDRRSYGVYETKEEAIFWKNELVCEASFRCSDEEFWIIEEEE